MADRIDSDGVPRWDEHFDPAHAEAKKADKWQERFEKLLALLDVVDSKREVRKTILARDIRHKKEILSIQGGAALDALGKALYRAGAAKLTQTDDPKESMIVVCASALVIKDIEAFKQLVSEVPDGKAVEG